MTVDMAFKTDSSNPVKGRPVSCTLNNFPGLYIFLKSDELLRRLLIILIGEHDASLSNSRKQSLSHYFRAMEKMLPLLCEPKQEAGLIRIWTGEERIYRDKVSSQHIFASFKRHPE